MKTTTHTEELITSFSKTMTGYGHYKISIIIDGQTNLSAITSNSRLMDALNSDDDDTVRDEKIKAIEFVLDAHEFPYDSVTANYSQRYGYNYYVIS